MADRFNIPEHKIVKVNFNWDVRVPDYRFLQTTDGNGEAIDSRYFSSQETPNIKWKLMIFDRGTSFQILAFYYNYSTGSNPVDQDLIKMLIQIKDRRNYPHYPPTISKIVETECHIDKFECLDCLHSDDHLRFCCTLIAIVKKERSVSTSNPTGIAINRSDGLSTQLEGLFDSMQFSDVNIKISGRAFPAHKNILAARSEVFAAMFEHSTKEKLTNQIEIDDIEPDVFHQLLRFIYTGPLSATTMESMSVGLLIAADKYLLEDLKKECEYYLLRQLSPVNCLEILLNENLPGSAEQLKIEAVNFFRRQPEKVMATDQWKIIKQGNPSLLLAFQKFC